MAKIVFFLMAYNKINFYQRVIKMQELVLQLQEQDEDMFLKEIYWQYVYPQFGISYRTFHTWLGINAKAGLKKEIKKVEKNQLKLFDDE
ncbi:Transposase [Candidatus Ornithobacterium hominis]|uniref:hypothetical protein n=1 Tax=Candidatus Ornithobacterium hominis TaxID=2497989 RepID=UPI0024BD15B5|nr:hypothetical protein [Candidatus Ornithobacterium hominis]CAI9429717.1 Transposase [Candidatus Ornithobacterium hominis]